MNDKDLKKQIEELTKDELKITDLKFLRERQILQMCATINSLTELLITKKIIGKEEFIKKKEFFFKEMLNAQVNAKKKRINKEQSYIG